MQSDSQLRLMEDLQFGAICTCLLLIIGSSKEPELERVLHDLE